MVKSKTDKDPIEIVRVGALLTFLARLGSHSAEEMSAAARVVQEVRLARRVEAVADTGLRTERNAARLKRLGVESAETAEVELNAGVGILRRTRGLYLNSTCPVRGMELSADISRLARNMSRSPTFLEDVETEIAAASNAEARASNDEAVAGIPESREFASTSMLNKVERPFDWEMSSGFNPFRRIPWNGEEAWRPLKNETVEWKPIIIAPDPAKFHTHPGPPRLLSLLPDDENTFVRVFAKKFTEANRRELSAITADISAAPRTRQVRIYSADHDSFAFELQHQIGDSRFAVILGHSENEGRVLVLPNGRKINVAEIHQTCLEGGVTCLVLTCFGDDFGLTEEISARDAIKMWRSAMARHSGDID